MTDVLGGGTILYLCAAVRERLKEVLKHNFLETDHVDAPRRPPQIVNGFLPPKRTDGEPEFPFIIVRPASGVVPNDGYGRAKLRLIVGTFSEEYDGHEYAMQVFERSLRGLMERPTLERRYTLEYPLAWELFDEQPYPFWQLVATTEWGVPTPVLLPDEGVL